MRVMSVNSVALSLAHLLFGLPAAAQTVERYRLDVAPPSIECALGIETTDNKVLVIMASHAHGPLLLRFSSDPRNAGIFEQFLGADGSADMAAIEQYFTEFFVGSTRFPIESIGALTGADANGEVSLTVTFTVEGRVAVGPVVDAMVADTFEIPGWFQADGMSEGFEVFRVCLSQTMSPEQDALRRQDYLATFEEHWVPWSRSERWVTACEADAETDPTLALLDRAAQALYPTQAERAQREAFAVDMRALTGDDQITQAQCDAGRPGSPFGFIRVRRAVEALEALVE